jgi:hypothetical protein
MGDMERSGFPEPDDAYYFGKFVETMIPFPKYPNGRLCLRPINETRSVVTNKNAFIWLQDILR